MEEKKKVDLYLWKSRNSRKEGKEKEEERKEKIQNFNPRDWRNIPKRNQSGTPDENNGDNNSDQN